MTSIGFGLWRNAIGRRHTIKPVHSIESIKSESQWRISTVNENIMERNGNRILDTQKMALMALLMAVVFATEMMYFVFCHDGTLRKKRGYRKVVHFSDVDSVHQNLSEVQFIK